MLTKARADRDGLAGELEQLEQIPAVALHPTVIADNRGQVADLSSIVRSLEARL